MMEKSVVRYLIWELRISGKHRLKHISESYTLFINLVRGGMVKEIYILFTSETENIDITK